MSDLDAVARVLEAAKMLAKFPTEVGSQYVIEEANALPPDAIEKLRGMEKAATELLEEWDHGDSFGSAVIEPLRAALAQQADE